MITGERGIKKKANWKLYPKDDHRGTWY